MLLGTALTGCGEYNLLRLTMPDEHRTSFDALLTSGRAAYDRGDMDEALRFSRKAYELDPRSEDAAILYGFVNLTLAGSDPFSLAKELSSDKAAPAGGGAGDTLGGIKDALGLSDDERALLGKPDKTDPELPILIPSCAEDARRDVPTLAYLNTAILAVCPFVDTEARVGEDYRQTCEPFTGTRREQHRASFLWAFAHLTEALAFHAVLTYGTNAEGKSNLEARVAKIKTLEVPALLTAVTTLETSLRTVMPTGGACSDAAPTTQFYATLNDMLAVDAAFARIPGVPDRITKSIRAAMARVRQVQQNADPGSIKNAQARALKGDFNGKIAGGLAAKIDEVAASGAADESQKATLCAAFDSISGGATARPAACPAL